MLLSTTTRAQQEEEEDVDDDEERQVVLLLLLSEDHEIGRPWPPLGAWLTTSAKDNAGESFFDLVVARSDEDDHEKGGIALIVIEWCCRWRTRTGLSLPFGGGIGTGGIGGDCECECEPEAGGGGARSVPGVNGVRGPNDEDEVDDRVEEDE